MNAEQGGDPRDRRVQSNDDGTDVDAIGVDDREIPKPASGKSRRVVVAIFGVIFLLAVSYVVVLFLPKDKEIKLPRVETRLQGAETAKPPMTSPPRSGSQVVSDPKIPDFKEPPSPAPAAASAIPRPPITLVPNLPNRSSGDVIGLEGGGVKPTTPPDSNASARNGRMLARNGISGEGQGGNVAGEVHPGAGVAANQGQGGLESKMRAATTEGVGAKRITNPSLTITKGTTTGPIRLDTAISTEQPGVIVGTLSRDVRSTDGKVVLMTAGSKFTGEYQNGLEIGEERIFVLWTRFEDKLTHVTVDLASPGTDALGRAGLGGEVNHKFWQRFGAAILFSVIDDVSINVGKRDSGTTVNAFPSTANAAKGTAQSVIDIYKNVKPSLTQHQGANVSIIVARDLDFSTVYRLRKSEEGERP